MLIMGAVSGIQDYLFDVAQEGGRQARRLRARSFFVQLLSECACLRVRRAVSWNLDTLKLYGAGRFLLEGPPMSEAQRSSLRAEGREIERWLITQVGTQLRFNMALEPGGDTPLGAYERAIRRLESNKLRGVPLSGWVQDPISPPCEVCRHRIATVDERDEDTQQVRRVCKRCSDDVRLGGQVLEARTRFLTLRDSPLRDGPGSFDVAGLGVSFSQDYPAGDQDAVLMVANLRDPDHPPQDAPPEKRLRRPLARHIPLRDDRRPVEFVALARQASGAPLLGVLKMDVDSLGQALARTLQRSSDFSGLARFSEELDSFFARLLDLELGRPEWDSIYTVFSGGDDLLLVGPWDKTLAYAGHVQRLFSRRFPDLTISAGVMLIKPKHPLRHATGQAADLLEQAKDAGKDCCAALSQCWPWRHHQDILDAGARLAGWAQSQDVNLQRGWLTELLRLYKERHGGAGDPLATARLVYQVSRSYPSARDRNPRRAALRQWIDRIASDFDDRVSWETKFLPAVVRYALLATRTSEEN